MPLTKNRWRAPSSPAIRLNIFDAKIFFVFLLLIDKAAACAAFAAGFPGQPQNWTLLNCTIECCIGDNCNNQFVTVVPPTMVYTTTPNPVSPTFKSHGR